MRYAAVNRCFMVDTSEKLDKNRKQKGKKERKINLSELAYSEKKHKKTSQREKIRQTGISKHLYNLNKTSYLVAPSLERW